MFLRFCQILGISSGYVQSMFRVGSGYVQSRLRVCSEYVQSMFRVCSRYIQGMFRQGCIFRSTCSYPELTEDHVLISAYVKIFRTVTRNGWTCVHVASCQTIFDRRFHQRWCWLPLHSHVLRLTFAGSQSQSFLLLFFGSSLCSVVPRKDRLEELPSWTQNYF